MNNNYKPVFVPQGYVSISKIYPTDLTLYSEELVLDFAEWVDLNAVRNGRHEWTVGSGNQTKRYNSSELFKLYLENRNNFKS